MAVHYRDPRRRTRGLRPFRGSGRPSPPVRSACPGPRASPRSSSPRPSRAASCSVPHAAVERGQARVLHPHWRRAVGAVVRDVGATAAGSVPWERGRRVVSAAVRRARVREPRLGRPDVREASRGGEGRGIEASVLVAVAMLVAMAGTAEGSWPAAFLQLLAGAAFLGAVIDGLLLGHWYLTDRGSRARRSTARPTCCSSGWGSRRGRC